MNKGFTLIELLVVVLIIGILAAIALPQYTKAVERSRTSEAVQWLGDVATAEQIYYMQNNAFAAARDTLNNGDITIPLIDSTIWGTPAFATSGAGSAATVTVTATRQGGMYGSGQLQLAVGANGGVTKTCSNDANGFCGIVGTAGYTTTTTAAS